MHNFYSVIKLILMSVKNSIHSQPLTRGTQRKLCFFQTELEEKQKLKAEVLKAEPNVRIHNSSNPERESWCFILMAFQHITACEQLRDLVLNVSELWVSGGPNC